MPGNVYFLLDLRFSILCFTHGTPILDDPHAALRELLPFTGRVLTDAHYTGSATDAAAMERHSTLCCLPSGTHPVL